MNNFIDITDKEKEEFNRVVNHPLQSYEWGEFRKKTGIKVIRRGLVRDDKLIDGFTLTLHKIPKTKFYIGYLPKGNTPTKEVLTELHVIGIKEKCVFIQLEPNIKIESGEMRNEKLILNSELSTFNLQPAAHPLFTKYTFVLNLEPSEEELLAKMHSKTRYNIRVAEKHKVKVVENNSQKSFENYLKLMTETTNRQGFYAHTPKYHKDLYDTLVVRESHVANRNSLTAHIFNALYTPQIDEQRTTNDELTLTAWMLFVFKDHLYYPYGASSREHRETMSNNLTAWEAIRFGKKHGLKMFDMWGALGPEPDKNDPWYGFHRFKEGYGAELVEFVGSYDLIIRPQAYSLYKIADKVRWGFLKLKKSLRI